MNLGVLYELGQGVPRDPARAMASYRDACGQGHDESCVNLALLQIQDDAAAQELSSPLDLLEGACARGVALGCGALGQLYVRAEHGMAKDLPKALALLDRSCQGGIAQSCAALGAVLALGDDVARDPPGAKKRERRACELGLSSACLVLGQESLDEHSSQDAAGWFDRGCRIGDGESCGMLAAMTDAGQGVTRNRQQALSLYRAACRLGAPGSCVELLQRHEPLPLPEPDRQRLINAACEKGIQVACRTKR